MFEDPVVANYVLNWHRLKESVSEISCIPLTSSSLLTSNTCLRESVIFQIGIGFSNVNHMWYESSAFFFTHRRLRMPVVKNLWDNDMRLKLCLAVLKPMNFTPNKWVQICQSLGPAYSERHCKYRDYLSTGISHTKVWQKWMEEFDERRGQGPIINRPSLYSR